MERAACSGKSHLFSVIETDDISKAKEVKSLNLINFAKAELICASCPVKEACLDSANEEDMFHTFRAGFYPRGFSKRGPDRPRKMPIPVTLDDGLRERCLKGHSDWKFSGRGENRRRICGTCNISRQRNSRDWAKKNPEEAIAPFKGRECKNGHVGEYKVYADGSIACRECNIIKGRRARGTLNA